MCRLNRVNPREIYGRRLAELGEHDGRIVALSADVTGSNKFSYFAQKFPDRFFNVGIAEQNMVGIAAGLALSGKIPVVTSFAPFLSMRVCEQVRTDVCYVNLPVKLIGTCGGVAGGRMGSTHDALEDISIMRSMPNMTVIAPSDPYQCGELLEQMMGTSTPAYMRVGRGEDAVIYDEGTPIRLGRAITARNGADAAVIACGAMVHEALQASDLLAQEGIQVRVLDMHTISPIDRQAILLAAQETGVIVTAEDHFITGGLGTAAAEVLAESRCPVIFRRLGIPDVFPVFGDGPELYHHYGMDCEGICRALREALALKADSGSIGGEKAGREAVQDNA